MNRSFGWIRLGPGSVIYLGVTALVTIAAFYTQANLLFGALGLVIGAMVMSIIVSLFSLRDIRIQRLTPSRGEADEALVLRYHISNESHLGCFGVEIVETWAGYRKGIGRAGPSDEPGPPRLTGRPHGWALYIGPGQAIQAEAICWPRRRGLLQFERIIVRSGFPFGIFRKCVEFTQAGEVLIHPPQRRVNRQTVLGLSSHEVGQARHTDRGGGHDEFFGLRPYRPGDSFKLIDWKHSARTGNLVSREMAKARPPCMMILLDLMPNSMPDGALDSPDVADAWTEALEEAISLAGALVREAYLHEIHVRLAVQGADCPLLPIQHSQAHRQRLLDLLARIDLNVPTYTGSISSLRPTAVVRPVAPWQSPRQDNTKAMILGAFGRHPGIDAARTSTRRTGGRTASAVY